MFATTNLHQYFYIPPSRQSNLDYANAIRFDLHKAMYDSWNVDFIRIAMSMRFV